MKHLILISLIFLISASTFCQTKETESKFNFGFEKTMNGVPVGWVTAGSSNYIASLDSTIVKSGKYSAFIGFNKGAPDFKCWGLIITNNYNGKRITLSGFIKTENVSDGYAGLWMRIDPSVAFDNMQKNGIKGTSGWQKYEITLDMDPEKTKQIIVGGLLVGKGKMWLDDLKVTIDGEEIENLKPVARKVFPAENDKEFDQGSKISDIPLDKNSIDNLKVLGLVWGFIKYYHPNIAKGEFNWDYELFRVLPKVLDSKNGSDRDKILVDWINQFGNFDQGKEIKIDSTEIKFEPDLGWIKNSNFSNELTSLLLTLKNAVRSEDHFYIGLASGVGNPEFKNENPYSSLKFPDPGYRLLALYRYWNIIQYYYPYKNLFTEDWKNVLEEFIPKIIHTTNETEYFLTVLELIARIHDTHANIWRGNQVLNNYFGINYAAIELSFIENKAVVTGYYNDTSGKETGLKVGDVITKVNNQPVEDIVNGKLKITPASNYPTQLRNIAQDLLRTNDTIINIEFIRKNEKENKTINAYSRKGLNPNSKFNVSDTCFRFINKNIAYINNGSLKKSYLPGIWKEMQNTKGLIIDLRNYPSDFPIYDLCSYLMKKPTPFAKSSNGSIKTPGLFIYTKSMDIGKKNKNPYKGKIILLVNEISQSSAEFHAMGYKAYPKTTIIGSTTAGADGNVSFFYLPDGISTAISGIGIYYPDGRETQRIGIVPDIEVKPTIKGITEGRDELIEKAIELINK